MAKYIFIRHGDINKGLKPKFTTDDLTDKAIEASKNIELILKNKNYDKIDRVYYDNSLKEIPSKNDGLVHEIQRCQNTVKYIDSIKIPFNKTTAGEIIKTEDANTINVICYMSENLNKIHVPGITDLKSYIISQIDSIKVIMNNKETDFLYEYMFVLNFEDGILDKKVEWISTGTFKGEK